MRLNLSVRPHKEIPMKLVAFLFALLATIDVHASDRRTRDMTHDIKVCEETAALLTAAYTLHPADAQRRVNFINEGKDRIARDMPNLRIDDRHIQPPLGA